MKAKGVIRDVVPWENARTYFFYRVRRRLAQDALVKKLKASDDSMTHADAISLVQGMVGDVDWEDDKAVFDFLDKEGEAIEKSVEGVRVAAAKKAVAELMSGLSEEAKAELLSSL